MNLLDIVNRQTPPEPWAEGEKIPWNEPGFSQRMLKEHLSQTHDAASRRFEIIDRQVAWIHHDVLSETPTKILDLGCGPGFYTHRLARLGHECVGIDFSPASVAYASAHTHARGERTPADGIERYREGDIRTAAYGEGYGLAMLIYGEFNVFRRSEAETIVKKAYDALTAGGFLLLEPHTFEGVRALGAAGRTWYSAESGLFSPKPHFCLEEGFWHADQQVAIERYYVIDATSGDVTRYSASVQAYDEADYREMLEESGFVDVAFYPSLTGTGREDANQSQLMAVIARKPTA